MLISTCLLWGLLAQSGYPVHVEPHGQTASEPHQTDDPAIWVNRRNPSASMILGTVKMAAPDGAISDYRLDGSLLMRVPNIDRPNNIDIAYGVTLGTRKIDIAVATERNQHALRVFEILPGIGIKSIAQLPVFAGETGPASQPMGIALYTRPSDKALFAIVSRKSGPDGGYLWQYRLESSKSGTLTATKVRAFGHFSMTKEIEAVALDAERGHVYYSDEGAGIRKYHADPDHPQAAIELALFATTGWKGDREGIAIHKNYIVATDQQPRDSVFHVFSRDTLRELGSFTVGSDTTDGIDISSNEIFVAMNDNRKNFLLVHWPAIAKALHLDKATQH